MEDDRVVLPQPININSASCDQLMLLRGIGVTYAVRIVEGRPYRSIEALVSRKLIPPYIFDTIKRHITTGESSPNKNRGVGSVGIESAIG